MTRKITWLAAAAVVLALALWLTWAFMPAPFEVELAVAGRGPLVVSVNEEGLVRARDRYMVSAPIAANMSRVDLRVGDQVSAGQPLVRLSPLPLSALEREEHITRLRVTQARAKEAAEEVERARDAMEQAQRDELRAAELLESGFHSKEKHEQAKLALTRTTADARAAAFRADAAAADVRYAEIALKLSEDTGRVLDVFAPVEGTITQVLEKAQRVIQAGTRILEISDTSRLEVVVPVLSSDAVKIKPGGKLILEKWGGDTPLQLRVRQIEPQAFTKISALGVEEQRVNVLADLIGGPPQLGDGYRIEARFIIDQKADTLKVPASAVFRHAEGWAVFALVGNQARRIAILPGLRNPAEVEVLSGIEPEARVIMNPPNNLTDGSRVTVMRGR